MERRARATQYLQAYDALGNALGQNALVASNVHRGEIAALNGGFIADVWQSSDDGNAVHSQVLELGRVITGDGSDETITGFNDDDQEIHRRQGRQRHAQGRRRPRHDRWRVGNDTIRRSRR